VRAGRWTVDFLWRERRLVVETGTYRYHGGEVAFEDDHDRELGLRALGFDVVHLTGRQLANEEERVAVYLRGRLSST
jgi:very-short-patch-repair endonuclease